MRRRSIHEPRVRRSSAALLALLAVAVLLGSATPLLAEPRTVRAGLYENEPKIFTDPATGKPKGIFVDLLDAIAAEEGWKLVWVPGTWDEDLEALEEGRIDLMPDVAYSTERDEIFDFHTTPVVESWSNVYAAPGRRVDRFSQLNGARVAVLKNSIQHKALAQMAEGFGYKIELVPVASLKEAFQLASNRTVDAAVANHLFGDYFYLEYGLVKTPIVFNAVPLFYSTASQKNHDLLDAIDRNLDTWIAEPGSVYYQTLDAYTKRVEPSRVPEWVPWVLSVGAGLLFVAFALAVLLRWQVAVRTESLQEANEEVRRLNVDLERRVAERTAELESANKDLESFSYSVSHDLRAPLRAISGFSQIIARRHRADLNEEGRHYVDNVVQASERMGQLIDDLLTYSRLGRKAVNFGPVALSEIVKAVASDFAARVKEAGGTLEIAEELPVVHAERTLLTQILTNLLDNAVTYRREDVALKVHVDWEDEGSSVVISVADNGIGILADYRDKVFNVFQRFHSEDQYPGTGIGLANVKKGVDMLGGSVWFESVEGEGTTFYVRLAKEC